LTGGFGHACAEADLFGLGGDHPDLAGDDRQLLVPAKTELCDRRSMLEGGGQVWRNGGSSMDEFGSVLQVVQRCRVVVPGAAIGRGLLKIPATHPVGSGLQQAGDFSDLRPGGPAAGKPRMNHPPPLLWNPTRSRLHPAGYFSLDIQHHRGSGCRMKPFVPKSVAEQVAAHLRSEILRGGLRDELPGYRLLAERLGVNHKTMSAALGLLEKEEFLVSQGSGRCCKVRLPERQNPAGFRVTILPFEDDDRRVSYHRDILDRLESNGHAVAFAAKSLTDLHFDVNRVERYVLGHPSDAWVVIAGSRAVLEWFAGGDVPVFALAGRSAGLPIAGATIRKSPAITRAVRRLVDLGHRRMVMLVREDRRKPMPGIQEQAFLDELEAHGIRTGSYNLPDWEDTTDDFHRCLDSLFGRTPPTALIIDEAPLFFAVLQFLAQCGLSAPRNVSLVCLDPNPCFTWSRPSIAHIRWHPRPLVARIVRWAYHVARGKDDRRNTPIKAEFVEGGTVGPAACGNIRALT
jgi:DNA-binding LacI/PurR family transcriptional regulator